MLDELDAALLRELQRDARLSNRELAARTGVAPSTALERVRRLRSRGVLRGYHADVDLAALGRPVQALIAIRIRRPSRTEVAAVRRLLEGLPDVLAVFVVTGAEDFLVHVAVADTDALYALVVDRLTSRPEVYDVRTSIVYEHTKRSHPTSPLAPALGLSPADPGG